MRQTQETTVMVSTFRCCLVVNNSMGGTYFVFFRDIQAKLERISS